MTDALQVSLSAFCFLFSEMVQYQQNKVNTTQELEKKLAENGYGVGLRMSELCFFREKNAKREIKIVGILSYIKDNIWKTMFGKPADSLERATDKQDECNAGWGGRDLCPVWCIQTLSHCTSPFCQHCGLFPPGAAVGARMQTQENREYGPASVYAKQRVSYTCALA